MSPPADSGPHNPSAAPAAIEARGLRKSFGHHPAVADVSITIPVGSFFGLVGPNGAGKTTTLSMLTGLLRPDAGDVHIAGVDLWRFPAEAKRLLGVVPDGFRLFDRLTAPELLTFAGQLRGLDPALVAERSGQLLDLFELTAAGKTLVIDFSTGMKKKITLAAALLHDPQVLVMDEPFEGVDPISQRIMRSALQQYVSRGRTVLCSSHAMDVVERLCDHVAVLAAGTVRAMGPTAQVQAGQSLEEAFFRLVGNNPLDEEVLPWLGSSSD
ncbi:MAG: ABC transporter ATP-binding protein [Angustibacter sp.]